MILGPKLVYMRNFGLIWPFLVFSIVLLFSCSNLIPMDLWSQWIPILVRERLELGLGWHFFDLLFRVLREVFDPLLWVWSHLLFSDCLLYSIQKVAIEMFKVKHNLCPKLVQTLFCESGPSACTYVHRPKTVFKVNAHWDILALLFGIVWFQRQLNQWQV